MSFFTLPPEVNSLRMFLGAGSAPMLEAAAAWDGLAAELGTAAQSFGSVISTLAGQAWQGPAAAAMAAAAAPYAGWLSAAASQSMGAAGQARAVVSAFEAARAGTVHPGAVDANRNAFVQLVMSNLFGQNAPLIAMAESIYEEMWAMDVTAMAGYYANAAAAAAQVVPWQTVLQSFPALTGGLVSGLAHGNGAGTAGAAPGATSAGGGAVGGGAVGGGAAAGGGGGGGDSAGGAGAADTGLAPASYTSNPGSYTGGEALGAADAGPAAAATTANTGVPSAGVGGFGMMPIPMGGLARAGLLGDSPTIPTPAKTKTEEAAPEPETTEATEATETAETPEVEVPAMSVLPTAAPEIAAAAAQSETKPAAQPATGSSIPATGLRAASPTGEADETPAEFYPRATEEEAPKVQIRGA